MWTWCWMLHSSMWLQIVVPFLNHKWVHKSTESWWAQSMFLSSCMLWPVCPSNLKEPVWSWYYFMESACQVVLEMTKERGKWEDEYSQLDSPTCVQKAKIAIMKAKVVLPSTCFSHGEVIPRGDLEWISLDSGTRAKGNPQISAFGEFWQ